MNNKKRKRKKKIKGRKQNAKFILKVHTDMEAEDQESNPRSL
jgi:hypothetical protein